MYNDYIVQTSLTIYRAANEVRLYNSYCVGTKVVLCVVLNALEPRASNDSNRNAPTSARAGQSVCFRRQRKSIKEK